MKRHFATLVFSALALLACTGKETKKEEPKANAPETKTATAVANRVKIKTNKGDIVLELNAEKAPITVANFLEYVNKKHYDGTVFHRVIGNFMIQGGGFVADGTGLVEKATGKGIKNEASNGLKNDIGTVAMARTNDPNSATAQFFINVAANNNLNAPSFDGHGYAVFGKVVEGMEVVNAIKAVPTGNRPLTMIVPTTGQKITQPSPDVPNDNVVIQSITVLGDKK
jgi:peptidyl-prolyl cis-trans isomerase A (cyclophilin A)